MANLRVEWPEIFTYGQIDNMAGAESFKVTYPATALRYTALDCGFRTILC